VEYLRRAAGHSSSPILVLTSRRNFWGRPDLIQYEESYAFNPSMLCLPYVPNNDAIYVSVARNLVDPDAEVQSRNLIASLIYERRNERQSRYHRSRYFPTYMMVVTGYAEDKLESLVHSSDPFFPKCATGIYEQWPWYQNIQGPEDGRLVWSRLGEPLLIYNSISPEESDLCRCMYIIDLRSIYPALELFLSGTEGNPPIRFPYSVPLIYPDQTGVPKNWAVFTNAIGEVFVHTDLIPQQIYKLNLSGRGSLPWQDSPASELAIMEPLFHDAVADDQNCIALALNQTDPDYPVEFHQSSPMLEVILCTSSEVRSGLCDPSDPRNRVFILLFHVVHRRWDVHDLAYEARIVTLNSTAPYNYISISKPLVYCISSGLCI